MLLCAHISATGCVNPPPEFTQPLPRMVERTEWRYLYGPIYKTGAFPLSLSSAVDCADNSAGKNFFAPSPSFLSFFLMRRRILLVNRHWPLHCRSAFSPGEGNAAEGEREKASNLHIPFAQSELAIHLPSSSNCSFWSKSRIENLGLCFLMSSLLVEQRALTPNCLGLCNVPLSHLRTMLLKGSNSQPLRSNSPITLLSP